MIKVYKPGSTGLDSDYDCILVDGSVSGYTEIDKLNSHTDVEFSYPIIKTDVTGEPLANNNLLCNDTLICGSSIVNHNQNESQYLIREGIINSNNSLFIIYSATASTDGSTLYVKGSDYMNVDALQQMLAGYVAQVAVIQADVTTRQTDVISRQTDVTNKQSAVADMQTTLNNQISANQVNYNNTMASIQAANQTYIQTYGAFATFY